MTITEDENEDYVVGKDFIDACIARKSINTRVYRVGEKVKGEYFGTQFHGVITEGSRPHTLNHKVYIYFVDFSHQIYIESLNDIRSGACLEVEIIDNKWTNKGNDFNISEI